MKLIVTSHGLAWRGRLRCRGHQYPAALGRSGIQHRKQEGDGRTPAGEYALRLVLYRAGRMQRPKTALPVKALGLRDGWCDAPAHPAYNRLVRQPIAASSERLWRSDPLYDLIVVIGFNDRPVQPGKGSAIFLHLARANFAATQGCIALQRSDLLRLLALCDTRSRIEIRQA